MVQDVLICNQALKQGKPRPPSRSRRREPLCKELQIKEPTWSELEDDTKRAWTRESNKDKDLIIAQLLAESKVPVTKNHNLRTAYRLEFVDSDGDGYYSDCTANSEGTWGLNVNSAMFDTTTDNNSNGESVLEGSDLTVNAAAAKKQRPSILKGSRRKILKSSEMLAGAVPKMMASKQLKVMDGDKVAAYLTYSTKMTNIDYSCCDSLVPDNEPVTCL